MSNNLTHIISGCKSNDRKAQEKLYKMFFPAMIRMCMKYTQDRSEAMLIVNDGFLKVFMKIDHFENKGSLEGWIRRIVYHSMSDYYRKNKKKVQLFVFEDFDTSNHVNVLDRLFAEDIIGLLKLLPKASAEVFKLFAIEGFSHKEIAKKKSISIGTSKWHLAEARKKLQKLILIQRSNQEYVVGQ